MRHTFSSPTSLHRYQVWWQNPDKIVSAQNAFGPGQVVDFEEVRVMTLDSSQEITVRVRFMSDDFYVLAKAIDPCIGVLCELWRISRQNGKSGEFCFQQVERAVRKLVRAKLQLV